MLQRLANGETIKPKLTVVSDFSDPVVTTAAAKTHARITSSVDDSYIDLLIASAARRVQDYTRRALLDATWNMHLDVFPKVIVIPFPPIDSVVHLKYYNSSGVLTTMASGTDFQLDDKDSPARIYPGASNPWPATELEKVNAVEIQFIAGYGTAADIPALLVHCIKELVTEWYERRAPVADVRLQELPHHMSDILASFKIE